jgi:hypothetical protein
VWELDGPMPILKMLKILVGMGRRKERRGRRILAGGVLFKLKINLFLLSAIEW